MASKLGSKKRKAVTRDAPEADEVALSDGGDDFETALFNGIDSQGEDDVDEDDDSGSSDLLENDSDTEEEEGSDGDLVSDEVPSEGEDETDGEEKGSRAASSGSQDKYVDGEPAANYTVAEDANGNTRYIYKDIDPVQDSDDSDAPATQNTIGNIPLSFYDAYPIIVSSKS